MKIHTNISDFNPNHKTILTIGTFDGVHKGHYKILQKLIEQSVTKGLESTILTFFPHPRMILKKDTEIKLLHTLEEKKQILTSLGVNHLIIHPFTKKFSELTALSFVKNILVAQLYIQKILVGYDHRFGKDRTAGIYDLKKFGQMFNFEVEEISVETTHNISISSTKIRKYLQKGDVVRANYFLGREYSINGIVVKGKALGRVIAFPTANIQLQETYKLLPKNGAYIVKTNIDGQVYFGMMNIGINPTVNGKQQSIEVHLLDFLEQDLYGKELQIMFLERIRKEQKFESLEKLQTQLRKDRTFTEKYVNNIRKSSNFI